MNFLLQRLHCLFRNGESHCWSVRDLASLLGTSFFMPWMCMSMASHIFLTALSPVQPVKHCKKVSANSFVSVLSLSQGVADHLTIRWGDFLEYWACILMSAMMASCSLAHRYGRPQAACREPAGGYDKTTRTAICFEQKTQYLLIHAPYTRIVVFWHMSNIPPMILQSQISCNTPTFYIAAIFVEYCYTTGSWLL